MSTAKVGREDIEAKLREIESRVAEAAGRARPQLVGAAALAAGLVVLGAYMLGRRRGKRRSALVEVRRV